MSHQVEANGVHQTDSHSNLVPVLTLRPLSKSLRIHQGQLPPAVCLCAFVVGLGLRDSSG